jgi:hypothetical protein
MQVVQENRHPVSQCRIERNCGLEQFLLHIAGKIGPKLEGRATQ